jgi:hypothetical protein
VCVLGMDMDVRYDREKANVLLLVWLRITKRLEEDGL